MTFWEVSGVSVYLSIYCGYFSKIMRKRSIRLNNLVKSFFQSITFIILTPFGPIEDVNIPRGRKGGFVPKVIERFIRYASFLKRPGNYFGFNIIVKYVKRKPHGTFYKKNSIT